jgi:hypothetical protein
MIQPAEDPARRRVAASFVLSEYWNVNCWKEQREREPNMEAFVITATLFGSFATAFYIQRAALEGLFRMMDPNRRERQ